MGPTQLFAPRTTSGDGVARGGGLGGYLVDEAPGQKLRQPSQSEPVVTDYCCHAGFTSAHLLMLDADEAHRVHAIFEHAIADVKERAARAPAPSGTVGAGTAWAFRRRDLRFR